MTMKNQHQPLTLLDASVADVALQYPHAVEVLDRYNLDYCCNGSMLFTEACALRNIVAENIWDEIVARSAGQHHTVDFTSWTPVQLIDFIRHHHHSYIRKNIPQIQGLLETICSVHGENNITVLAIRDDFEDLADDLTHHLQREEEEFFPAVVSFAENRDRNSPEASNAIRTMMESLEQEHRVAGELVRSLRTMTVNYTPPDYACPTFRLGYKLLKEFDNDLVQHIHIENNILFQDIRSLL
jgi:regulator of cell morphogenesis and NO signaling